MTPMFPPLDNLSNLGLSARSEHLHTEMKTRTGNSEVFWLRVGYGSRISSIAYLENYYWSSSDTDGLDCTYSYE